MEILAALESTASPFIVLDLSLPIRNTLRALFNMFFSKSIFSAVAVVVAAAIGAQAETHTVTFDNRCGYGTVSNFVSHQTRH